MMLFKAWQVRERIVYEDRDMLVLYKPAGVAVQSAKCGQMDLESAVKQYLVEQGAAEKIPYLGIVHRLDQPVAGLVLFGKHKRAAAALSAQLQQGKAGKYYLALAEGICSAEEGILEDYLAKQPRDNRSRVVGENEAGAKKAVLKYRVLERANERTLLEVELFTGRHHQIRVQLAHAGMALVGDRKYNPQASQEPLGLCAYRLRCRHPINGKAMEFQVPQAELRRFGCIR